MVQFFLDYGLFLAKAVTVVAAVAAIVALTVGLSRKDSSSGGLTVEKLNDRYRNLRLQLRHALLSRAERRKEQKQEKKQRKAEEKSRHPGGGASGRRRARRWAGSMSSSTWTSASTG